MAGAKDSLPLLTLGTPLSSQARPLEGQGGSAQAVAHEVRGGSLDGMCLVLHLLQARL